MAGLAEIQKIGPFHIRPELIENVKNPDFLASGDRYGFIKTLKFPKDYSGSETVDKRVLIVFPPHSIPAGSIIDFKDAKVGPDGHVLRIPIILKGGKIKQVNVNPYEISVEEEIQLSCRPRIINDGD